MGQAPQNPQDSEPPQSTQNPWEDLPNHLRPNKKTHTFANDVANTDVYAPHLSTQLLPLLDSKYNQLFELQQRLREGDPETEAIKKIFAIIYKLRENLRTQLSFLKDIRDYETSLHAASPEIAITPEPPPLTHQFKVAALKQIQSENKELARQLAEVPVVATEWVKVFKKVILGILAGTAMGLTISSGSDIQSTASQDAYEPSNATPAAKVATTPITSDESSAHVEEQGSSNGPANLSGRIGTPDTRSGGTPGHLPEGMKFAQIDFSSKEAKRIYDNKLWMTVAESPDNSSANLFMENTRSPGTYIAKVTMEPRSFRGDQSYYLPHPPHSYIGGISVSPETKYTVHPHRESHYIRFDKDTAGPVEVSYKVYSGVQKIREARPKLPGDDYAFESSLSLSTLEKLRKSPKDARDIAREHMSHFRYITSNELADMVDAMPGTFQEKTEHLQAGDCDVLSSHLSALFNAANLKSVVIHGYQESSPNDELKTGAAHAQVAYAQKNAGDIEIFESTGPASKNGAFVNVTFQPEDKAKLEAIAQQMRLSESKEERAMGYKSFREALNEILNKPYYKKFLSKDLPNGVEIDDAGFNLLKDEYDSLSKQLAQALRKAKKDPEGFMEIVGELLENHDARTLLLVGVILGVLILGGGMTAGFFAYDHLKNKRVENLREVAKKIAQALVENAKESGATAGDLSKVNPSMVNQLKERYKGFDELSSKQQRLLLIVDELIGEDSDLSIHSTLGLMITSKMQWEALMDGMGAAGFDPDLCEALLRAYFESPKNREKSEKATEEAGIDIAAEGRKKAADKFRLLKLIRGRGVDFGEIAKILDLKRIGSVPVSKRRHSSGTGVWNGAREYAPGDDFRMIDHKASARTDDKLIVREREPEFSNESMKRSSFSLCIDVCQTGPYQLEKVAAILYAAGQFPQAIKLNRIEIYANGKLVRNFAPTTVKKLLERGAGGNIEAFIQMLLKIRHENSWFLREPPGNSAAGLAMVRKTRSNPEEALIFVGQQWSVWESFAVRKPASVWSM